MADVALAQGRDPERRRSRPAGQAGRRLSHAVAFRRPRLGRPGDAWPGITISGVVVLATAVLADAFGDPPRGGPRLLVGLALGALLLLLGYLLRFRERGRP